MARQNERMFKVLVTCSYFDKGELVEQDTLTEMPENKVKHLYSCGRLAILSDERYAELKKLRAKKEKSSPQLA